MKRLFSIGEMAKLFGINVRTLRYYDQEGLLRPVRTDPETGYRYYCVEQFEQLNTIRYLRAQGISLAEIRTALAHRNPEEIRELLRRQEELAARRLRELRHIRSRLRLRVEQIDDVLDFSLLNRLRLQQLPPRPLAVLERSIRAGEDLELPLRALENQNDMEPSYFLGKVGLSIAQADLERRRFDRYQSLFCLLDPGEKRRRAGRLAGGLWALWRFRGSHAQAGEEYAKLLDLLEEKGLALAGDGAEFALLDFGLTEHPEDFVTELQLPVTRL